MTATKLVRLWLHNDYRIYRHYRDLAESIMASPESYPAADLAQIIRADVWDSVPDLGTELDRGAHAASTHGIYQDLISHSLRDVDWFELADSFLEDVEVEA